MVKVNLLPWRLEERQRQKKQFRYLTVFILLTTFIIVILLHAILGVKDVSQQEKLLQAQIDKTNIQINQLKNTKQEKLKIESHVNALLNLEKQQHRLHDIIKAMQETTPQDIALQKITGTENSIVITGIAPNNASINRYVNSINDHTNLRGTYLKESKISEGTDTQKIEFTISTEFVSKRHIKETNANASANKN